jgi:TPR repeat protein
MKQKLWAGLFTGILASALIADSGQELNKFRIFSAADGRVIEAKIVAWNPSSRKLQIERTNGKKVWVQPGIFSAEDQTYVKTWITANQFLSKTTFRIKAEKIKGKPSDSGRNVHYDLSFDNRTGFSFEGLKVDYRLYVDESGHNGRQDSMRCVGGKIEAGSIPSGEKSKVSTADERLKKIYKQVAYTESNTDIYGNTTTWTAYEKKKIQEDQLQGIWLRISGPSVEGTPVIREFFEPSDLNEKFSWVEHPQKSSRVNTETTVNSSIKDLLAQALNYQQGKGVKKDPKKALELYEMAYEMDSDRNTGVKIINIYLRQNSVRDEVQAEQWAKQLANQRSGWGYNAMALYFANSRNKHSNGEKAVKFALLAADLENDAAWILDTLACAYAQNGQFDLAVETQEKAYKKARKGKESDQRLKGYQDRLNLFKKKLPWPQG